MNNLSLAWCINGHGYGAVDENGLCLRRCLRSRKVRRQMRLTETRKEVATAREPSPVADVRKSE